MARSFHPHQKGHTNTARVVADHIRANVTLEDSNSEEGSVDPAFQGHWRSPKPAEQPSSTTVYYVVLTIRGDSPSGVVGEIYYPGLECSGSVTLVHGKPDELVLTERIERDPVSTCVKEGTITLVPSPDGSLALRYVSMGNVSVTVTARLVRT